MFQLANGEICSASPHHKTTMFICVPLWYPCRLGEVDQWKSKSVHTAVSLDVRLHSWGSGLILGCAWSKRSFTVKNRNLHGELNIFEIDNFLLCVRGDHTVIPSEWNWLDHLTKPLIDLPNSGRHDMQQQQAQSYSCSSWIDARMFSVTVPGLL